MEEISKLELKEKINKLEQEVEFYKTIADNTFDWEVFRAPNGQVTYVNQAFERITGHKSADWIHGKISPEDFIHPEDMEKAQASIKKALNKEAINDLELRIINKDKQPRHVNLCSQPVYKNNRFIGVRTSIRDITEQKQFKDFQKVYESLKESERRFKAYIINSPIAIFIVDSEGRYTFVNPVVCKLLGYSHNEMLKLSIPQILPADKVNIGLEHFKKLKQTGEIQNTEIQFIKKDKTLIDVVLDTIKLSDNKYIAYVKDITHIKETERQLKKQIDDYAELNQEYSTINEEYKSSIEQLNKANAIAKENEVKFINQLNFTNALIKHLPIPVFYKDNEGKYLGCNPAYEEFTGKLEKQVIGKKDADIWPEELAKKFRKADLEMIRGNKKHLEYEFQAKDKNGYNKNIITTKTVFYDKNNPSPKIVGAYLEVTKHRETKKVLRQHLKRLKILYELNQMSEIKIEDIYDYILERSLEICNSKIGFLGFLNDEETIVRIHSWSASAMEICKVKDQFIEFEVAKTGIWGEVLRQRKPIIINDYKADNPLKKGIPGGHVPIINYLSIPYFDQGKIIAIIAVGNKDEDYNENDIKELSILMEYAHNKVKQKQFEIELIQAKEKAEASEEKHRLLFENMTQGVVYHNNKGEIIYANQAAANILGLTMGQLYEKTSFDPRWKSIDEEGNTLTGNMHPVSITLRTSEPVRDFIMGVHIPQKNDYRWININSVPVFRRKSKKPHQVIVSFEDISQRKQAEKDRLMKEKLKKEVAIAEESNKFKQNFLANMSHEIRTPLTGILGMVDVLGKTKLSTDQRDYLSTIFQSGENLREIINNVLDFSKIEAGKMQLKKRAFKLETLIINAQKLFNSICFKPIKFIYKFDPGLPQFIKADENRLKQIINNLVSNAVKFTGKGKVEMNIEKLSSKGQSKFEIKISISDTGKGISNSKQKKLFEPFSQIDDQHFSQYEGTGLGLSICKELAQLHGGKIGVSSELGKGSTFWFTFIAEKADKKEVEPIDHTQKKEYEKSLNILLVEDIKVNQKVFKLLLSSLGHNITIVDNGLKALEIFAPGKFDLVLMDIQMPIMNGVEATKTLKEKYSELPPIVGLSANAFEGDKERYMAEGLDEYLTKPLKEEEFNQLVIRLFQ